MQLVIFLQRLGAPQLMPGVRLRCSTSPDESGRNMEARGKRAARRPWILVDTIPRPEGAQYSVARFAGSVSQGDVIPGLRSSRCIGTRSPGAKLCRPDSSGLVDADIRVDAL